MEKGNIKYQPIFNNFMEYNVPLPRILLKIKESKREELMMLIIKLMKKVSEILIFT